MREIYLIKSPMYMSNYIRETDYIYRPARVMSNLNAYGDTVYCVDIFDNMGVRSIYAFPQFKVAKHFSELLELKSVGAVTAFKSTQKAYDKAEGEASGENFNNMLDLCFKEQMVEMINKSKGK